MQAAELKYTKWTENTMGAVGAASSKHIKSAYRTEWTFIWPLMYYALALRKCLENY